MSKMKTAEEKIKILKYSEFINDINKTCELFDISRTTYYSWKKKFEEEGYEGLIYKKRENIKKKENKKKIIKFNKEEPLIKHGIKNSKMNNKRLYDLINKYKTTS